MDLIITLAENIFSIRLPWSKHLIQTIVRWSRKIPWCKKKQWQRCAEMTGDIEDPSYPHIATADLLQNIIHQQLPWASLCVMCLFLLQEAYYNSVFTAGYKCGGGVDGGTWYWSTVSVIELQTNLREYFTIMDEALRFYMLTNLLVSYDVCLSVPIS